MIAHIWKKRQEYYEEESIGIYQEAGLAGLDKEELGKVNLSKLPEHTRHFTYKTALFAEPRCAVLLFILGCALELDRVQCGVSLCKAFLNATKTSVDCTFCQTQQIQKYIA